MDAKTNTGTGTGTGEPIYWVNGAKVADNYADFYDNSWDSQTGRNESGATLTANVIWTGCNSNGTSHATQSLGTSGNVRWGTATSGSPPLSFGGLGRTELQPLYALSPVLTVSSNSAPEFDDGATATRSFPENTPAGRDIGAPVAATDSDAGDTLTYTLGGTDAASFDIVGTSGQLRTKTGVTYDFETKASYTVTVTVTDATDSDTITVTISLTNVPGAPAALTLGSPGQNSFEVSWVAPADGGSPITGYTIQRAVSPYTPGDVLWEVSLSDPARTSHLWNLISIEPATTYQVRMRAVNANGNGPWSAWESVTTAADTTPTFQTATVNGTTLTLTYDEFITSSSIPATTAFTVMADSTAVTVSGVGIRGGGGSRDVTLTLGTAVTNSQTVTVSYTVPGTNPIQDNTGNGAAALSAQAVTNVTGLPAQMSAPTLAPGHYTIEITWVAPSSDGGSPITRYEFERQPVPNPTNAATSFSVSDPALRTRTTGTDATPLTPGDTHRVRVRAVNANGPGGWSSWTSATLPADNTSPALSTATVNGTELRLTYNEPIHVSGIPPASAYTVTVDSTSVTVNNVSVSRRQVILTLGTPVTGSQTVTLSYAVPTPTDTTFPVQDYAENLAAALTGQAVTNVTDLTAPALSTAAVDGTALVLTYDEPLDTASTPAATAFTVEAAGSSATVSNVAVSGSAVTLTLATATAAGQRVLLWYAVPSSNPIQDVAGNDAAALTRQVVTNLTGAPAVMAAPMLGSPGQNGFEVSWVAPDDGGSPITQYDFERAESPYTPGDITAGVSLSDPARTSYLWERVSILPATTYQVRVRAVNANSDGPWSAWATVTTAADTTPTLQTATVDGATLTLTYDEFLDPGTRPAASAFTVTAGGSTVTVSAVGIRAGRGSRDVTLTLAAAVTSVQTVTVSYAVPGTNPIQDNTGNDAAALTNRAVTNNTPAVSLAYAGSFTATLSGDTFTAGVASGTGVAVTNLPPGLTASYALNSGRTEATLTLTGRAASHANSDDVSILTVTFADAAFTNSTAAQVTGTSKSDLSIDFNDGAITWAGGFTERSANDGSVTGSVTATLSGDTFTAGVAGGTGVAATNLPPGLTASYALNSGRTALTLTLTGRAASHANSDDVDNLTVTFADAAFTNSTASQVANAVKSDLAIDFNDLPPQAPGAPSGLTLTAGDAQLTAAWTAPADPGYPATVTGYVVQYRTSGSWRTWTRTAQNATDTTETITGLTNGRSWYVRVAAVNTTGTGRYTSQASARPVEGPRVPGAVTGLTLTPGEGRIRATWTAPADTGNPRLNGYTVQYRISGQWLDWRHSGTGRSATITGLTNGTTYQVRVAATNTTDTGGYDTASARPAGRPTVPLCPPAENLAAMGQTCSTPPLLLPGHEQIEVIWGPPANDGGSPITAYSVQYRRGGGSWQTMAREVQRGNWYDENVISVVIPHLTNGRSYQVRVAAENPTGTGPYTATRSATPNTPAQTPSEPRNVVLTPGDGRIEVSWREPVIPGHPAITGYEVQYKEQSASAWTDWTHRGTGTAATITGLTNGTTYQVKVRAVNPTGNSPYAGEDGALSATPQAPPPEPEPTPTPTPTPEEPVSAPGQVDLPSVAQTGKSGSNGGGGWVEVKVSWSPPTGEVRGYKMQYRSTMCSSDGDYETDWFETQPGKVTSFKMRVFDGVRSMEFRVKAFNDGGDGAFSASRTFTNSSTSCS